MSARFSNLLISSILREKSENLNFFIKIGNQLVSLTFNSAQTVKSLKILIEKIFQIPSRYHFLKVERYVLKDMDKIGEKINEKSIISLNFRLLGGMIDPPYSAPLHGLEIILVNSINEPINGTKFDPNNNPLGLPSNLVCRIYTDCGNGTGFAVNSARRGTLIITAKHVVNSPLGQAKIIGASFEHIQDWFGGVIIRSLLGGRHRCEPKVYKLKVVDFDFSSDGTQRDPITRQLYSIHDDIIALRFTGKCICGARNRNPPLIDQLQITPTPNDTSPIILLGFPGEFTDKAKVFPVDVSNSEFNKMKTSFATDVAIYTEGEVLRRGTVSCISASSVGGMSGSPVLWLSEGEWKIGGMLLGGPAVSGHRRLLNILRAINENNKVDCNRLIDEMANSRKTRNRKIGESLKKNIDPDLKYYVEKFYFEEIRQESLKLSRKGRDPKVALNHNLVYDCYSFISQIIS